MRQVRCRYPPPTPPREFPPTADQVATCPPHYWLMRHGWQECKKCWSRRPETLAEALPVIFPRGEEDR